MLPRDANGRLLLVRHSDSGQWGTIGGSVEVDEAPADAAVREASEEAGVQVSLGPVTAALGGPQFRVEYPNGDRVGYVAIVYEADVVGGMPNADHDETSDVAWFAPGDLATIELNQFARATFAALGLL